MTFAVRQATIMAWGTFTQALRSRLLHGAFATGAALLMLARIGDDASSYSQVRVSLDAALGAASVMGHVLAACLGLQMQSGEGHKDSEYTYLCRPLGRETFLLGRASGAALLLATFVAVIGGAGALGVWGQGHAVPGGYAAACAILPLELSVTLSLACLFGSASSRPLAATCTAAVWLAGQLSDELRLQAEHHAQTIVGPLLQMGFWLLPDFARLSLRDHAEATWHSAAPLAAIAAAYGAAYAVSVMGLACAVYARRGARL